MLQRPPGRAERRRERQRRYLCWQALGWLSVTFGATPDHTAKLCRAGYLREHELEDRVAIGEAVRALLDGVDA